MHWIISTSSQSVACLSICCFSKCSYINLLDGQRKWRQNECENTIRGEKLFSQMTFVFVSPSQASQWGTKTRSVMLGEQHQAAARAAGWTLLLQPSMGYDLLEQQKSFLTHGAGQILENTGPSLTSGLTLFWIHLQYDHVWVTCSFCHTGITWNSSLTFSGVIVSHPEELTLACPPPPTLQDSAQRLYKFGCIANRFFFFLSLPSLTLLLSFTDQALSKHWVFSTSL